jgi:hypothetical protein
MKTEKEIREKLKQIEDAIKLELNYTVSAPLEYYRMRNELKWILG